MVEFRRPNASGKLASNEARVFMLFSGKRTYGSQKALRPVSGPGFTFYFWPALAWSVGRDSAI